jgi:thiamine-phosphate pyrophosphorylase
MRETSLPAFAIGGIGLDNIDQVAAAGARRVAVSQAICQASNPQLVVEQLLKELGLRDAEPR